MFVNSYKVIRQGFQRIKTLIRSFFRRFRVLKDLGQTGMCFSNLPRNTGRTAKVPKYQSKI